MLYVALEGSSFERGFQHGQQFASEIGETIRVYCPEHWLTSPEVHELERRLLSSLAAESPDLIVEMVGISKGAGVSFGKIALLNLVLATNDLGSDSISKTFKLACSAVGFSDSDAGPIVAKNCDETQTAAPFYLFQTTHPEEGMAFMGISWVGTVWMEGGMNEAGLAFMQTAGPLVPNQDGYGVVCNIVPRIVLAQGRTVQEGVNRLREMRVAGWGMGAVLVDLEGSLAVIEKTYDLCAASLGQDGVGYCTNHFLDPVMKGTVSIAHEGLEENSNVRYRTLTKLFMENDWSRTLEGMKETLAYHGEAGFVCQHGDAGLHTNYSCIAIPRARKILLGDGYPCLNNYSEYCL